MRAETDAIDRLCAIVTEAEDVAVAAHVLAELAGHRQAFIPGAQEDFGGAEGAGRHHDDVGFDEQRRRRELLAATVQVLEVHDPAIAVAFQMPHLRLAENLRAMVPGVRQIIHQRGVLGLVVTARDAVAAMVARQLLNADMVEVVRQFVEGHVDRRPVKMRALLEVVRRLLVGFEFRQHR